MQGFSVFKNIIVNLMVEITDTDSRTRLISWTLFEFLVVFKKSSWNIFGLHFCKICTSFRSWLQG